MYVGLRPGYTGSSLSIGTAQQLVQNYCNREKLCVTVTPTTYIYVDGSEPGLIVGLLNYPRFPSTGSQLREHAFALAKMLLVNLYQNRVSMVLGTETVMLERKEGLAQQEEYGFGILSEAQAMEVAKHVKVGGCCTSGWVIPKKEIEDGK